MDKKETAVQYKHSGYNCCQAVLMAYQEELGLSEEMIKKLGASYGVGMGCMGATCGATVCKDLKGLETGKVLCPCDDCVRNAVTAYESIKIN